MTSSGSWFSVMTDPHDALELDNVTYSDTTETDLASPAISISPVVTIEGQGRRVSATNHQHSTVSSFELRPDAEAAYANPDRLADRHPGFHPHAVETPAVTLLDTDAVNDRATGSNNYSYSAPGETLVLATFSSQPWDAEPARPYLDIAPQPLYVPKEDIAAEQNLVFDRFDNPTAIWPQTQSFPNSDIYDLQQPKQTLSSTNRKPVDVFAAPPPPKRSGLKRKAEHLESPASKGTSNRASPSGTDVGKTRTVSFERMSGLGPTSPDEESTSSDLPSTQNRGNAANNRRQRQSTASTPRAGGNNQTSQQPRTNRGTRVPSGHPPSILQSERVFSIQIGSELFRLSGASISSDGKAHDKTTWNALMFDRSTILLHSVL